MDKNTLGNNAAVGNKDNTFDVYSVIRSAEIRDYFRKEKCMGIFEKESLILHSYISVQQKAAMLKELSRTGDEEENKKVDEMYHVYTDYINRIYHPEVRTVFLVESVEPRWEGHGISGNGGLLGAFDTLDEVIGEMEKIYYDCQAESYGEVTMLQVPQDAKVKEAFRFTLYWIDGSWQIKDLEIDEKDLEAQGVSEDTVHQYGFWGLSTRHSLPFKNGDLLKLQLPFMKVPYYGILGSEKDGNGCWYHWLNDWEIDLSYAEIGLTSGYSTFDWIERAYK